MKGISIHPRKVVAILMTFVMVFSVFCFLNTGVYAADTDEAAVDVAAVKAAATVFNNGTIYTVEGKNWDKKPAQSVAVDANGTIVYVGTNKGVEKYIGKKTKVYSLYGRTMFPGFIDSHLHAPGTALTRLTQIYIGGADKKDLVLKKIKDYVTKYPDLEAYWGRGFQMSIGGEDADGKGPKKEWLDEICSDKPMVFTSNDGHCRWLNSKALELSGITKDTPNPVGGMIHKDSATGELWGTLGDASSLVKNITPASVTTPQQQYDAYALFQKDMHTWGYTGFLDLSGGHNTMKLIEDKGEWKMRANTAKRISANSSVLSSQVFEQSKVDDFVAEREAFNASSKLIRLNTAKFFYDGVVEGSTAYLVEPYLQVPEGESASYRGEPLFDFNVLKQYFNAFNEKGIQIHVHSVGDQSTEDVVNAMEYSQGLNPGKDVRNTITHLQLVTKQSIVSMGALGIIAAAQPYWALKEPDWYEFTEAVLIGEERGYNMYPLKSFLTAGAKLTFSGDHSVTDPIEPFWAIEASVTRNLNAPEFYEVDDIKSINDKKYALSPGERVTVKDAIEAYTINGAYQLFREKEIGSIKVGKKADFLIVGKDPFKVSPLKLDSTKKIATVFNGKVVAGSLLKPPANSISKVTVGKKNATVAWKKINGVTKYQVRYKVKGAKKWITKNVSMSKSKLLLKGLKKGKVYQFQVRSYKTDNKKKYYSPWSKVINSKKVK